MLAAYYGFWDYWALYHKVTFDGENKLIYINEGVSAIDVKIDLYSDSKEWIRHSADAASFLPPMRTIGGDPTEGGNLAGDIYFLTNGWQIYLTHSVTFTGDLFSDDFSSPFIAGTGVVIGTSKVSALAYQVALDASTLPSETAAAVWGANPSGFGTPASANTFGHLLGKPMGICTSSTLTTTSFSCDRTESDNFWTPKLFVQFTGNVTAELAGFTGKINTYTSNTFTIDDTLPTAPAAGDSFYIINE